MEFLFRPPQCRQLVVIISVFSLIALIILQQRFSQREVTSATASSVLHGGGGGGILPEFPFGRTRFDNKRLLRILDFFRIGTKWEELVTRYGVCLSSQSSIERVYWLPQVLERWKGPMSLAVYVASDEEWLVLNLYTRFLDRCSPGFRDRVSMHLALPSSLSFQNEKLDNWNNNSTSLTQLQFQFNCRQSKDYLTYLLQNFPTKKKESLALKETYPQNHMRNIARKGCGTNWTFSADVDIIPGEGLAESLQQFYESVHSSPSPCDKCAFVIPTFELDENVTCFPQTKKEIVDYLKVGAARPFHDRVFATGHKATNYKLWTTSNLDDGGDGPVKVSHSIDKSKTYMYEPFYVSSDTIPPFDERFVGYGFTRNSQFQEALYAGWNFSVLTPAFAIHWGLQTPRTLLSPTKEDASGTAKNLRDGQTKANEKLFKKIIKEMKLKKQEGIF